MSDDLSHKSWRICCGQPYFLTLLGMILLCFMAVPALAEETSHLLDGKVFVGNNGEKGKQLDPKENEEIVFADGLFKSVSCVPYNFGSSPYQAEAIDGKIHFSVVTESPTHGKIAWRGIVDGNQAEMTFVWTKERWYWNVRREYWFQGTQKE